MSPPNFLMRISKKSEYALRALTVFARDPRSHQVQELSKMENIPVKFLEQILLALRHGGLLTSKRGVGGGYTLRIEASRITVGRVIRIMDGPITPVACAGERPRSKCSCPDPRTCALRLLMIRVREGLGSMLDGCTLEELARLSPGQDGMGFEI
jgi:Rrf2 family protein